MEKIKKYKDLGSQKYIDYPNRGVNTIPLTESIIDHQKAKMMRVEIKNPKNIFSFFIMGHHIIQDDYSPLIPSLYKEKIILLGKIRKLATYPFFKISNNSMR